MTQNHKAMNNNWKETKTTSRTFMSPFGDESIHIIKTGFKDMYMVVWEDVYETVLGKVEFFNKKQIKKQFKLDLDATPELSEIKKAND